MEEDDEMDIEQTNSVKLTQEEMKQVKQMLCDVFAFAQQLIIHDSLTVANIAALLSLDFLKSILQGVSF